MQEKDVDEMDNEPTVSEQLIACLEDDAAKLKHANPDDEMAETMLQAAKHIAALSAPAGLAQPHANAGSQATNGLHDNKATMAREMWRDGKLLWHVTAQALAQLPEYHDKPAFGTYPDVVNSAAAPAQQELDAKGAARYRFVKTMSKEMLLFWRGAYGFDDAAIDAAIQQTTADTVRPASNLAEQVANTQAEMGTWSDEKRSSVRLEGNP